MANTELLKQKEKFENIKRDKYSKANSHLINYRNLIHDTIMLVDIYYSHALSYSTDQASRDEIVSLLNPLKNSVEKINLTLKKFKHDDNAFHLTGYVIEEIEKYNKLPMFITTDMEAIFFQQEIADITFAKGRMDAWSQSLNYLSNKLIDSVNKLLRTVEEKMKNKNTKDFTPGLVEFETFKSDIYNIYTNMRLMEDTMARFADLELRYNIITKYVAWRLGHKK